MGAQRRCRHPGAGRGARDLLQSGNRLKQLSGLERTDQGKRAATATEHCRTASRKKAHSQEEKLCEERKLRQSQSKASHCWLCSAWRIRRRHRMPRHLIRRWPQSSSISWTELPRSRWRAAQHRMPFHAMPRFSSLAGVATKPRWKARMAGCAWRDVDGGLASIGPNSGARKFEPRIASIHRPRAPCCRLLINGRNCCWPAIPRSRPSPQSRLHSRSKNCQLLSREPCPNMMAKSAYLTDNGGHNAPHRMFYAPIKDVAAWGANIPNSPVMAVNYWYLSEQSYPQLQSFPAIAVFLVGADKWSDGTQVLPAS